MLLRVSIEGPALAAAIGRGATAYRRSVLGLLGELCGAGSRRSATVTTPEDGEGRGPTTMELDQLVVTNSCVQQAETCEGTTTTAATSTAWQEVARPDVWE